MEGLAAAALSIIDDPTINDANPILSKRPGIERQLAADVRAEKERAALKRAKKGLADQPHIPLNPRLVKKGAPKQDLVLETSLKKIATRGVVQLFNAVRSAQRTDDADDDNGKPKTKRARLEAKKAAKAEGESSTQASKGAAADLSRDSFLDILRRGTNAGTNGKQRQQQRAAAAAAVDDDAPGARFLRDDFMLGRSRARDFEREMEEDEDDGYVDAGARGVEDEDEEEEYD